MGRDPVAHRPIRLGIQRPAIIRLGGDRRRRGKPFLFFGQTTAGQISLFDTTQNTGRGPAGPTLNVVYLFHGEHIIKLADPAVPAFARASETAARTHYRGR
jgi:hypothetical protein